MRVVFAIFYCVLFLYGLNAQSDTSLIVAKNNQYFNTFDSKERLRIDHKLYFEKSKNCFNQNQTFELSFPINNESVKFKITPNNVLDDSFKSLNPEILTFDIVGFENKNLYGALTFSPFGMHITIYGGKEIISIYPESHDVSENHIIEYGVQSSEIQNFKLCGHEHNHEEERIRKSFNPISDRKNFVVGDKLYTYRVAIVTTGEFYKANGNNDFAVTLRVISTINAINAIFKNELSFQLQTGSLIHLFNDADTDPFIPDESPGAFGRTVQAGNAIQSIFNQNSYDIGHVFHTHQDGDDWGSGGIAAIRSVCSNTSFPSFPIRKAQGWSGSYDNVSNAWINLATHEFGHQFGANHTFNGIGESCTGAISSINAFEIGSGTTIMAYQGICETSQNLPSLGALDNYFHTKSIEEMVNYVYAGEGGTCGNPLQSDNNIPEVIANVCNAVYNLPKGTAFYLKAIGSDIDDNSLTYAWEQIDEDGPGTPTQGFIGEQAATSTVGPLFRSFPPSPLPERYFPSLRVLSGTGNNPFEVLPKVSRNIKFNIAVRDNHINGGAQSNDIIEINVLDNGPFLVSRPVGGEILEAGNTEIFSWEVNGSEAMCSKMRIKLSVDGGNTYDFILAENITYSEGFVSLVIPSTILNSVTARIMMECMDFDCFKIFAVSSSNFTINSSCLASQSFVCPTNKIYADQGSSEVILNDMTKISGNYILNKSIEIRASSPTMRLAGWSDDSETNCVLSLGTFGYHTTTIVPETSGLYRFSLDITGSDDGRAVITVYDSDFNPVSPCSGFVGSNLLISTGFFTMRGSFFANLSACREYIMVFSNTRSLPRITTLTNITGTGRIIEKNVLNNPDYITSYIAVNTLNNVVSSITSVPDFRQLPAGLFKIYSISHLASENLQNLLGITLEQLQSNYCIYVSSTYRELELTPSCLITDIEIGLQSICNPTTNQFSQSLTITYNLPPNTGFLSVNEQIFEITQSPQSVVLQGLESDELNRDVNVFFTENPGCRFDMMDVFTAPENCCIIEIPFGGSKTICPGEIIALDAGTDGVVFEWFRNGELINQDTRLLSVISGGLYKVKVTNISGCIKSEEVLIISQEAPIVILPDSVIVCDGSIYLLEANVSGISSNSLVIWTRNGVEIEGASDFSLEISQQGEYGLEIINEFGCIAHDKSYVSIEVTPSVELGPNLNVCVGTPVLLFAGDSGNIFSWFKDGEVITGEIASIFSPLGSGLYSVLVSNDGFCSASDEIFIRFFEGPFIQGLPDSVIVCQGQLVNLSATVSGFQSAQWFANDNMISGANSLNLDVFNSDLYKLQVSDIGGCTSTKLVLVDFKPLPDANLKNDQTACDGFTVTLGLPNHQSQYVWTHNGILLSESANNITISQSGLYAVTVTNAFNCMSSDEVNVSFVPGPSLDLGKDTSICRGDFFLLRAITNGERIRWFQNGNVLFNEDEFFLPITETGEYIAIVSGGFPICEASASVNITVNPKPNINLGQDKIICEGDSLELKAGQILKSYRWILDGQDISNEPSIIAKQTGSYSIFVTNEYDCSNFDNIKVTVSRIPSLDMPALSDLCEGSVLVINPMSDATNFKWYKENILFSEQTIGLITLVEAGEYTLEAFNANGCFAQKTLSITERPTPTLSLGEDITLCPGEMVELDGGFHDSYLWSDGSKNSTVNIQTGNINELTVVNFKLTVANSFGCTAIDSIKINMLPVINGKLTADKQGVCYGKAVKLTAEGGQSYIWSGPQGSFTLLSENEILVLPENTTTYTVEINDECPNNRVIKTIEVKYFEPLDISGGNDTCVILGRTIRLGAKGGVRYNWNNTEFIKGASNVSNPLVEPLEDIVFIVTITDLNGCIIQDQVNVCVITDPLKNFKPVSIITPNGDGKNDELYFNGLEAFPDNNLKIYNRWGNIVFEAVGYQSKQQQLFNGFRNNQRLPADTYYYILIFEDQEIKSALTILWD